MDENDEIELLLNQHASVLMEAAENEANSGNEVCTKEEDMSYGFEDFEDQTELSKEESSKDGRQYSEVNVTRMETVDLLTETDLITSNNESAQSSSFNKRQNDCNETLTNRTQKRFSSSNTYNEDDNDEFQALLDTEIVSCVSERRNRYNFIRSNRDNSSDDETDIAYDTDSGCDFISEIMADDELELRERCMEQLRKELEDKTKRVHNNILVDLIEAERLVLERDSLFTKLVKKLQEEIRECGEKQKKVRKMILNFSKSTTVKEPCYTRSFFKKFGMPYFEDSNRFTPLPNEDYNKKLKNGQLNATSMPKLKYWTKLHKNKLEEAIKITIINEHSERLINTINKLKCTLANTSASEEKAKVEENLVASRNELKSLGDISYSQLLERENPCREYDWMKYSASVFDGIHSAEECRRFWHVYLKPTNNKSAWDDQENLKLVEIAKQMHFQDWDCIAQMLGTKRTAYQCFVHYQTRLNSQGKFFTGKWTQEEDDKLLCVINASKIGDFIPWTKVASHFSHRTHNQIYARFVNSLNPKLVKGKFTKDEDLLIVSGVEVFGANYKEIASLMSNRNSVQVRERYERYLLPKTIKFGPWSLEEDEQLLRLSKEFGHKNFAAIAEKMKTRSRTQVRQRFNCIQKYLKSKPGWTPAQGKRTKTANSTTRPITQKFVDKVKQQIETVEKTFKLTKIESDTFRIEKMKELRDKVLMKKYDLKRKKKVFSDSSQVNHLLMDYFKDFNHKSPVKISRAANSKDFNAYLNEILLLSKYFGHELKLPEFEDEIQENPKLSFQLKLFLKDNLNNITNPPARSTNVDFKLFMPVNSESSIDYEPPLNDDTSCITEMWHSPPINVLNLNFSEFFKPMVFEYSYGMHKDIWESKKKRSQVSNLTTINDDIQSNPNLHQSIFIPPNQLTALGYRSLILSRSRLRRLSKESFQNLNQNDDYHIPTKVDLDLKINLLNKFQETLVSLFTWPKILSLTNITSTPILPVTKSNTSTSARISTLNHRNIVCLINNSDPKVGEELQTPFLPPKNKKQKKKVIEQAVLDQNLERKRKIIDFNKGIRCKRKMKIEHLMDNVKEKSDLAVVSKSNKEREPIKRAVAATSEIKKSVSNEARRTTRRRSARLVKNNLSKVNQSEEMVRNNGLNNTGAMKKVNDISGSLYLRSPPITYSRTQKYLKNSSEQQSAATKTHLSCSENTTGSQQNPSNKENYVLD